MESGVASFGDALPLWSCRDDVSRPPLAQHSLIVNSPSAPDRRFTITRRVGYNEPMRLA